jgi:hypothetical protein
MAIVLCVEKKPLGFAAWEEGGAEKNTGSVIIVADPEGRPKRAHYVRTRGHLANGRHALVPVVSGDVIIFVNRHGDDYTIEVCKIADFTYDEQYDNWDANCDLIAKFSEGAWDDEAVASRFDAAIKAACDKAADYHCCKPYYIV